MLWKLPPSNRGIQSRIVSHVNLVVSKWYTKYQVKLSRCYFHCDRRSSRFPMIFDRLDLYCLLQFPYSSAFFANSSASLNTTTKEVEDVLHFKDNPKWDYGKFQHLNQQIKMSFIIERTKVAHFTITGNYFKLILLFHKVLHECITLYTTTNQNEISIRMEKDFSKSLCATNGW